MTPLVYAIFFLYILIPLQFALNPTPNIDLAIIRVFILCIVLIYYASCLKNRRCFIPTGIISSMITLFLMLIVFSLFITPVPYWTLRKIVFFYSFFPLFYVLVGIFYTFSTSRDMIIRAIIYSGIIASCIGLMQFVLQFFIPLNTLLSLWSSITPFFLGGSFSESVITHNSWLVHINGHDLMRVVAFFPDPHICSFYLSMIIPLSLGMFYTTTQRRWLLFSCIICIADLLTFSRGGYIGLASGLLVGVIIMRDRISIKSKHLAVLFILTALVLLLIPHNPISHRFISSFGLTDNSSTHRVELWKQAIDHIISHPLMGTGLGSYAHIVNPHSDYRTPIYVHNLYLDIFVELGVIGIMIIIILFIRLLFVLWRNKSDFYNIFVILSIVIYLTHSIFDTAIFSVHTLPLLIYFFALGSYYENTTNKKHFSHI